MLPTAALSMRLLFHVNSSNFRRTGSPTPCPRPAPRISNVSRQRRSLLLSCFKWYGLSRSGVSCIPGCRGNLRSGECIAGEDSDEPVCETVSRAKSLILLVFKSKPTLGCCLLCVACDRSYLSATFFTPVR